MVEDDFNAVVVGAEVTGATVDDASMESTVAGDADVVVDEDAINISEGVGRGAVVEDLSSD